MVWACTVAICFFFFNDTAPTEIYTLSLHDALPIFAFATLALTAATALAEPSAVIRRTAHGIPHILANDYRSEEHTLNSSHANISYAVFCLKKKNNHADTDYALT